MRSDLARRIQWLVPVEREVYRTQRTVYWNATDAPNPACERCGSRSYSAHGTRQAIVASVRDRGTRWKNMVALVIHLGCVPSNPKEVGGIAARRRR